MYNTCDGVFGFVLLGLSLSVGYLSASFGCSWCLVISEYFGYLPICVFRLFGGLGCFGCFGCFGCCDCFGFGRLWVLLCGFALGLVVICYFGGLLVWIVLSLLRTAGAVLLVGLV